MTGNVKISAPESAQDHRASSPGHFVCQNRRENTSQSGLSAALQSNPARKHFSHTGTLALLPKYLTGRIGVGEWNTREMLIRICQQEFIIIISMSIFTLGSRRQARRITDSFHFVSL